MNDYIKELVDRDQEKKPIKIIKTEEISCRCPNDDYEVGWGVPGEELDLFHFVRLIRFTYVNMILSRSVFKIKL